MKAEDIIEGLNRHIENKRKQENSTAKGHLVLQRIIMTHPTFKAYKTCKAILWFVINKERYSIIEVEHTDRVIGNQYDNIQQYTNIELCNNIFNWIGSDSYNSVLKGECDGISKNTN